MPEVVTVLGVILTYTQVATLGWVLIVAGAVWGAEEAERKKQQQEEEARNAYNRSLRDRNATIVSADSPHVYVYGRARVGSSIVAMLSSGNKDQYKHLVCIHASHECDAIEEIYIAGKALGTLDGSGNVTTGDYAYAHTTEVIDTFTETGGTLSYTPDAGTLRVFYVIYTNEYPEYIDLAYTLVGNVISGVADPLVPWTATYTYQVSAPKVRVQKHLVGTTVDAITNAELGSAWPASATLTGFCYTIVRIDLNHADFQGGCPSIEVLLRGKKLHDVRSGSYPNDTPVWSQNPALIIADYLTSEMCAVPYTDLPLADYITAANVCDENITAPVNIGARYNADGTVNADQSQAQILEKMAQSMAGSIAATTWRIQAGKYIAPVMALSQSDIVGDMQYTAGSPESNLYNGVKGQYISAENIYVLTDFAPYQNSAYVAADGAEFWTDNSFTFTNTKQRVHNLCRIFTEDNRNAFTIVAQMSYKCWALQVGQRVTFTSTLLGQSAKVYRITKKTFSADAAVEITMKEDIAEIWDFEDAVEADATPNTNLPNPLVPPPPVNIQVTEELYETTNSSGIKVRAIITWDDAPDVNSQQYDVKYKGYYDGLYSDAFTTTATQLEVQDIATGRFDVKVRSKNNLNIWSAYSVRKTFEIIGLTALPANVTGFTVTPFNGSALARWARTADLDVKIGGDIEIRLCQEGTAQSWEKAVTLPDGTLNGDATNTIVPLSTGMYYAKFVDSSGNYSATAAQFPVTESLISGWTTVATSTQHPTFTGTKTNVVVADLAIKLDSATLIDDMLGMIDSIGSIDAIGGIVAAGTYEFAATMDLSSVAVRRFHARMKLLSYNANDYIDSRFDNIDLWTDVDGGAINSTSAVVYIKVSNDDITYTDWTPFLVSDFGCRYAKFKVLFASSDSTQNIQISELEVKAKVLT